VKSVIQIKNNFENDIGALCQLTNGGAVYSIVQSYITNYFI